MATKPDFLNDNTYPYNYLQTVGITDVNTIISDLRTQLTGVTLAWTEPSTALFKSPPDTAGKFVDILCTRITQFNIEFRMRDYRGATICTRRIQIDNPGPTAANYYCSVRGVTVESLRATPEIAQLQLLDPTPDLVADVDNRTVGNGYRTAADVVDGNGSNSAQWFAVDAGAPAVSQRLINWGANSASTVLGMIAGSSDFIYRDELLQINQSNSVQAWTGRPWHRLACDQTLPFSSDKTVPLGDGTTGTFRVIGLATVNGLRVMCRKGP